MEYEIKDCEFRLFGRLFLPYPEEYLTKEETKNLQQLLPYLQRFERASPSEYTGPGAVDDDDVRKNFVVFKGLEVKSWLPTLKAEQEIVAPSGSIKAKIGIHLHHPSFVTDYGVDGEVCDSSNSCMQLVIGKGFNQKNAFWFDHFSRREPKSHAMKSYNAGTIACHEDWCRFLREHMHAKLEIVWGTANYKRLTQSLDLSALPLWGPFKGIEVYLDWMEKDADLDLHNRPDYEGKIKMIRRLILFVYHPEFFLHNYDPNLAWLQDQKINAAAVLAGVEVDTCYFVNRTKRLKRQQDAQDKLEISDGTSEKPLGRVPLKGRMRTQLLELAERLFNTTWSKEDEIYIFADLPEPMKHWLQSGQAGFSGDPITNADSLAHAYQEAFHPDQVRNDVQYGLKRMVFSLFCRHQSSSQRNMVFHTIAKFVEVRTNVVVPLKCSGCSRVLHSDRVARFCQARPEIYVARETRACRSLTCGTSRRFAIPRDEGVPWIRPDKKLLSRISNENSLSSPKLEPQGPSTDTGLTVKVQDVSKASTVISTTEHLELPPNLHPLKRATPSSLVNTSNSKIPYIMVPVETFTIERKCANCGRRWIPDEEPRFWSVDTRLYIARQSMCNSDKCNGRTRWMIPVSAEFGYIRGSLEYLSAKPSGDGRLRPGIDDYLLKFDEAPRELQKPVRTKCKNCNTDGKTEIRPRWTKDSPPVYHAVERECHSESCQRKKRLFIPVDSIPYVTTKALWVRQNK